MRPLIILITFVFAVAYGKPGGSYDYPAPTPSAAPAYLSHLATPSPSITPSALNLAAPSPSVAPQIINLASPTASISPSVYNLPQPVSSIAPSLYSDNLIGYGQYGSPIVNIGGQSLGIQSLGGQSLGIQSLGGQYLGGQYLGGQSFGVQPLGIQSLGGQSTGLQSFGIQPLNLDLQQSQINLPIANQGFNFGGLLPIGSPQLSVDSAQISFGSQLSSTPAPILSQTTAQFNLDSLGPTIATPGINIQRPGGVVVQKHIYVHVPPEEPEVRPPPRQIVVPPPRKHYKIIFIKAPTPPTPTAPVIPAQPQDDERTIVYVLVKRPEDQPAIKIQTPPPTVPAKPEVYFIRYATRKEGFASETIPSGPVPIEGGSGGLPIIEDKVNEQTINIGNSGLHTNVALNLNTASLSGGSALSLAVTGSPLDNALQVSSTPVPIYGPPEHK